MDRATVLLQDVGRAHHEAFRRVAEMRGLEVVLFEGSSPPVADPNEFCLSVIGSRAEDDCVERVRALRKMIPDAPIVVMAEDPDVNLVVELMRLGVADVVPPISPEEVAVERVLSHLRDPRRGAVGGRPDRVFESTPMRRLLSETAAAAPVLSTVLVTGETGTGKGLVARLLHELSGRSDRRFVHADCAALSPSLIEDELFGHEKGAFTGALARRPGRFELAEQGTIFLDEIGELEPRIQSRLLRILQDREYERVGGTRTLRMRARVVAATSRDLTASVRSGAFRADLYFRLKVIHFHVPPLRDRPEDLRCLVSQGLARLSRELGIPHPTVTEAFVERLELHSWPGNVRELMNVLEGALVTLQGTALGADAADRLLEPPSELRAPEGIPARGSVVADARGDALEQREAVAITLTSTGGNIARAARRLGLPRSTLRYRIRQLGLSDLLPRD